MKGRTIRKYSGSTRPPGIWPEMRKSFNQKQKDECIGEYLNVVRVARETHAWYREDVCPAAVASDEAGREQERETASSDGGVEQRIRGAAFRRGVG